MRRKDREKDRAFALSVLTGCEYAVLATVNGDGSPYAVVVSPVVIDGTVYFHTAKQGHKLDNLMREPRVCLTCVGRTKLLPEEFSTAYESAVVTGKAQMVEDDALKIQVLMELCRKYALENIENAPGEIERSLKWTGICKIEIEAITGKAKEKR